jgi:single-strand DNA-binding protein
VVSLNKAMIIGNVGTIPEMRFTPSGKPVASFSVATNRSYSTPEGERKEETEWFNVIVWNRLAEQCNQYLGKGRLVYAEGRLHTRTWQSTDGQKHYKTELIANRVSFLDRKGNNEATNNEVEKPAGEPEGEMIEPDDIPF